MKSSISLLALILTFASTAALADSGTAELKGPAALSLAKRLASSGADRVDFGNTIHLSARSVVCDYSKHHPGTSARIDACVMVVGGFKTLKAVTLKSQSPNATTVAESNKPGQFVLALTQAVQEAGLDAGDCGAGPHTCTVALSTVMCEAASDLSSASCTLVK